MSLVNEALKKAKIESTLRRVHHDIDLSAVTGPPAALREFDAALGSTGERPVRVFVLVGALVVALFLLAGSIALIFVASPTVAPAPRPMPAPPAPIAVTPITTPPVTHPASPIALTTPTPTPAPTLAAPPAPVVAPKPVAVAAPAPKPATPPVAVKPVATPTPAPAPAVAAAAPTPTPPAPTSTAPAPVATTAPIQPILDVVPAASAKPAPVAPAAPAPKPVPPLVEGRAYLQSVRIPNGPLLVLTGIAWSDTTKIALVNGMTLEPGDAVEGVSVLSIEPKRVALEYGGTKFYLRMH